MIDIILARNYLMENQENFVLVKDGEVIIKSKDRGIKPIFDAFNKYKGVFKGASVADRIIGEAAARFLIVGQIKSIYSSIISESAYQILVREDIDVKYAEKVPKILNMVGDDICPMEKLSKSSKDLDELIERIEFFLIISNIIY